MSTREPQGKLIARAKKDCLFSIVLVTVLFAGAATNPAVAQVQLPTVNLGDTNFEDAFGAPGWLFEELPDGYVAGELKDSIGQTVPGSGRVTTYSTTSHVVFLSKMRFLGGWLAGEALQPVVDVDVRAPSGSESRVRGFADLAVGTGLQWAPQKFGRGVFSQRAILDVVVPVGKYSDQRSVTIGNHFVEPDLLNDAIFGAIYYRFLLGLSPFTKRFGEELVEQAIRGNRSGNLRS
jgi:hypothetical protein